MKQQTNKDQNQPNKTFQTKQKQPPPKKPQQALNAALPPKQNQPQKSLRIMNAQLDKW